MSVESQPIAGVALGHPGKEDNGAQRREGLHPSLEANAVTGSEQTHRHAPSKVGTHHQSQSGVVRRSRGKLPNRDSRAGKQALHLFPQSFEI
mmetsp:Transcript_18922/g.39367  ORF Transcript_18922/g.39367 Transcript_18922/m.39367 type:complete len:92 (-) Transcript_18922:805-1080(-)